MFVTCAKCGEAVDMKEAMLRCKPMKWLCPKCYEEEFMENLPPQHIVEIVTVRKTRYADGTITEEVI